MAKLRLSWEHIRRRILACRKCGLAVHNPSPAYGSRSSRIMILGQSLHKEPNSIPFSCASGQPISEVLESNELGKIPWPSMGDEPTPAVMLTNAVHCFPAEHKVEEVMLQNCRPFIKAELHLLRPKVVIALGTIARRTMEEICGAYPRNNEVVSVSQHPLVGNLYIMGCMHPSAALRSGDIEEWKEMFSRLVKKAVTLVKEQ